MPTPARTSVDQIVAAGRSILEADGIEGLTMARVATEVGVRAPSLYKRVLSRADLIRLLANDAGRELGTRLDAAAASGDPGTDLRAIASSFRDWALSHPQAYTLVFGRLAEGARMDRDVAVRSSETLLRTAAALAGPEHALEAARTFVAWATGFVGMELAGAFQLGGDVDRAFAYGVDRLTRSIASPRAARRTVDSVGIRSSVE